MISGLYRGRRLVAPRGQQTRPTADRVREALFSMLADVEGARVLDLYAGSGALAIEALSRGAAGAVLVERDARALEAMRRNIEATGGDALVRRRDVEAYLGSPDAAEDGPFDLVFCDPPYSSADRVAALLTRRLPPLLAGSARIVTESDKRLPLTLELPLLRERTYGDTRIALHRA